MRFTIARYRRTGKSKLWPLNVMSCGRNWPILSMNERMSSGSVRSPRCGAPEAKSTNDGFQARPINLLSGSPAYLGTPHPVPLHHRAIPRSNDTRESSLAEEGSNSAALIIGEWQPWLSGRNAALGEKQH